MLIHGPYTAPRCKIGETICDLQYGNVVIEGKRNRWPLHLAPIHRGPRVQDKIPVLTSTLVKAILNETTKAIADHWGVSLYLVGCWRKFVADSKTDVNLHLAILKNNPETLKERFNIII